MKQWQVVALFAAGLVLGGTAVWFFTRSDDSSPRAGATGQTTGSHSTSSSQAPGVSVNGQQLLDRLDHASDATYHVRYSTGSASGSHATLEVWHTGDRVRRDLIAVSPSQGTAHTAEILTKSKLVRCVQFAGKPWQCVGAPITSASSALTDPLQGAKPDLTGRKVTVSNVVIAGHQAICYTVAPAATSSKASQFCLSGDNVPLRIDGGDGNPVDATNYDKVVPSSVFTPPAPVA